MTVHIPLKDFNQAAKVPYITGTVKGIGIDYQYNGIYGYLAGKEIEIFSFDKLFKLDNRYNSVKIYCDPKEITLSFSW